MSITAAEADVFAKRINKQANEVNKERSAMPFINEFASEEDIKKYDLYGLWDEYHPIWKGDYYLGQKPTFTIDRQKNVFFMIISWGREEHSNRANTLLWVDGTRVVVELDLVGELNSDGFKTNPYRIRWELVAVHPQLGSSLSAKAIIQLIKEALNVYGHFGIYKQIPNTVVEFNF